MFWYFISDHHVIFASKQQWTRDQHEPTITTIMDKTLLSGTWQLCITTHTLSFPNGTIHFGEIVGEANKSQPFLPLNKYFYHEKQQTKDFLVYNSIYYICIHFFCIFCSLMFLAGVHKNYQNSCKQEHPKQTSAKIASYCLGSMDLPIARLHQVDVTDSSRSIATEIDSAPVTADMAWNS